LVFSQAIWIYAKPQIITHAPKSLTPHINVGSGCLYAVCFVTLPPFPAPAPRHLRCALPRSGCIANGCSDLLRRCLWSRVTNPFRALTLESAERPAVAVSRATRTTGHFAFCPSVVTDLLSFITTVTH